MLFAALLVMSVLRGAMDTPVAVQPEESTPRAARLLVEAGPPRAATVEEMQARISLLKGAYLPTRTPVSFIALGGVGMFLGLFWGAYGAGAVSLAYTFGAMASQVLVVGTVCLVGGAVALAMGIVMLVVGLVGKARVDGHNADLDWRIDRLERRIETPQAEWKASAPAARTPPAQLLTLRTF